MSGVYQRWLPEQIKSSLHARSSWGSVPGWFRFLVLTTGSVMVLGLVLIFVTRPELLVAIPLVLFAPVVAVVVALRANRWSPIPGGVLLWMFAWGACVATFVAGIVNSIAALAYGDVISAVLSAPVIEEIMKLLAVLVIARAAGSVDNPTSGMVAGIMVGAGFTLVEDVLYLLEGDGLTGALYVALSRAVVKPFLHMGTTAIAGYALGALVMRGRAGVRYLWLLPAAVGVHAAWNLLTILASVVIILSSLAITLGFILGVSMVAQGQRQRILAGIAGATRFLAPSEILLAGSSERQERLIRNYPHAEAEITDWYRASALIAEAVSYQVDPLPVRYLHDVHHSREAFLAALRPTLVRDPHGPRPLPESWR